jgi:hypothetical protein
MKFFLNVVVLTVFVVASLGLCGCGSRETFSITDVTKTNRLNLVSRKSRLGSDIPNHISVHIYGKLDGTAHINADGWEPVKISGEVNYEVIRDHFATNAVLYYIPENVRSGNLKVTYQIN